MDVVGNAVLERHAVMDRCATLTRGCVKCRACAMNALMTMAVVLAQAGRSACQGNAWRVYNNRIAHPGLSATLKHLRVSVRPVQVWRAK